MKTCSPDRTASRRMPRLRRALAHLALAICASASAQQPAAPPPRTPAQTLELARVHLAATKARESELVAQIVELDRQTDARVNQVVEMLKGVRDSTDSNTEIQHTKKQAVEAMRRWIQVYAQERGKRLGQIQGGATAAAKADLRKEVAALDAEMNQRIDQVVELAASMSTSEDLKRYDTYYSEQGGVVTRERDEYRAARRQSSRGDQVQANVDESLVKAIEDIERQIVLVPQRLPRDLQEPELARLHALLKEREADLAKLAQAQPAPARAVGDREANAVDREMREAQQEIRGLWLRTQAKANLLSVERQRRRQLEALIKSLEVEAGAAP